MSRENLENFLGDMAAARADGTVKAVATVDGYCSTLKYYYRQAGVDITGELKTFFKDFHEGYKRIVAQKKENGVMKNHEGKVPVTVVIYKALAKLALFAATTRTRFSSFVHLFLLLCWNLFSRSCNVAKLRTHHFTWDNDALVIDMSKQKGDQAGDHILPKHIYANPYNPELCPILALALHVFSTSFREDNEDRSKIFMGTPYDLFCKWLQAALETMGNLGYAATEFGSHSFRKGITTFCAALIGGPSVIAIFQRAGWSLGQVQDRYFMYSDGGDQLCGRIAAGLNFNGGSSFAVLPPHFANASILSEEQWQEICPCYNEYPEGFQSCLPYFLASLVYHYDWLHMKDADGKLANISPEHPIFQSRVYTSGVLPLLRTSVIAGITSGRCDATGMTATGVPTHIELLRELETVRKENQQLLTKLDSQHEVLMEQLPEKVCQAVLENVRVEGVRDFTLSSMRSMLREELAAERQVWQAHNTATDNEASASGVGSGEQDLYPAYDWGGKMRRHVPQGWTFPRGTVKTICDLFVTGTMHGVDPVRPYRKIVLCTLPRSEQSMFSRAERVYKKVCDAAVEAGAVESSADYDTMTIAEWDLAFKAGYDQLLLQWEVKSGKRIKKAGDLAILTFYDYLRKL
jgi:hypothetical protein